MRRSSALRLVLLIALLAGTVGAEAQTPVEIGARVGSALEAPELAYFRLLPLLGDPARAQIVVGADGPVLIARFDRDGEAQTFRYPLDEAHVDALADYIAHFEARDAAFEAARAALPADLASPGPPPSSERTLLALRSRRTLEGVIVHADSRHVRLWTGAGPYDWRRADEALLVVPRADIARARPLMPPAEGWRSLSEAAAVAAVGMGFADGSLYRRAGPLVALLGWAPRLGAHLRARGLPDGRGDAPAFGAANAAVSGPAPPEAGRPPRADDGRPRAAYRRDPARVRLALGGYGGALRSGDLAGVYVPAPGTSGTLAPGYDVGALRVHGDFSIRLPGPLVAGASATYVDTEAQTWAYAVREHGVAPWLGLEVFALPSGAGAPILSALVGGGYGWGEASVENRFAFAPALYDELWALDDVAREHGATLSLTGWMAFLEGDFRLSRYSSFALRLTMHQAAAVDVEGIRETRFYTVDGRAGQASMVVYDLEPFRLERKRATFSLLYRLHL